MRVMIMMMDMMMMVMMMMMVDMMMMMVMMMMMMLDTMMMMMMMMMMMVMTDVMMMMHHVCCTTPHIYQSGPLHLDIIATHWHATSVASPNLRADAAVNTVVMVQSGSQPNRQHVLQMLRPLPADPRLHSHTTSTN
jgi:hypothetical protein